jgi:YD repeat-containing protein
VRTLALLALTSPALIAGVASPAAQPSAVQIPVNKGSVDLATGLYVRVNEDLVVPGVPVLALRRTYLSGFRGSREFGIGTTHSGEEYVSGDARGASLILARGSRISFTRATRGVDSPNARLVHDASAGEWHRAELRWTAGGWRLNMHNGSVLSFRACDEAGVCSITESTDSHGRTIRYRRNPSGQLLKMEAAKNRWIAFEYDRAGRIERAYDSKKRSMRYAYDQRGRLQRATASDGTVREYTYSDEDELLTIEEPGTSITNRYEGGRCVRQVNWLPERDPYTFEFIYQVEGPTIHRTRISESNGTWREYAWDDRKAAMSETHGRAGSEPAFVMYERDAASRAVIALTLSCRDRSGRPVRQRIAVDHREAEPLKRAMLSKLCN